VTSLLSTAMCSDDHTILYAWWLAIRCCVRTHSVVQWKWHTLVTKSSATVDQFCNYFTARTTMTLFSSKIKSDNTAKFCCVSVSMTLRNKLQIILVSNLCYILIATHNSSGWVNVTLWTQLMVIDPCTMSRQYITLITVRLTAALIIRPKAQFK